MGISENIQPHLQTEAHEPLRWALCLSGSTRKHHWTDNHISSMSAHTVSSPGGDLSHGYHTKHDKTCWDSQTRVPKLGYLCWPIRKRPNITCWPYGYHKSLWQHRSNLSLLPVNHRDNRWVTGGIAFIQDTKAPMVEDQLRWGHTVELQQHRNTALQHWLIIICSWNAQHKAAMADYAL